jgi:hypothetical protein
VDYLRKKKGLNIKTKREELEKLKRNIGKTDPITGNEIDEAFINNFEATSPLLFVYNKENKKRFDVIGYDPFNNESLLNILNDYYLSTGTAKEQVIEAGIDKTGSIGELDTL